MGKKYYSEASSKEEKIDIQVKHYQKMQSEKKKSARPWSDKVTLRKAINHARKQLRKVPLEPIPQGQYRRIWKKYERNIKDNGVKKCDAMYIAIQSGMKKSKAAQ